MNSIQDVLETFSRLDWKKDLDADGNGTIFTIVGGKRETGELYVFAAIQNASAPKHLHREGSDYGEKIGTFAGELIDVTDDGEPTRVGPDDVLYHGPGSIHTPRADFWFGYYHQPHGSQLVD